MCAVEFQYVVERQEQQKVCFLSGRPRYPPEKEIIRQKPYNLDITSAMYKTLNKVRSTRGVGGLSNLSPRFPKMRLEQIPGPEKYDLGNRYDMQPSYVPFGKSVFISRIGSKTPGPGSYPPAVKCRRTVMLHTFGGRTHMDPAVESFCIPKPSDTCAVCKALCVGDYWQNLYTTFLCLKCMRIEKKKFNKFTKAELKEFRRMRNCTFMHQHDGTTAAIRLMPKKLICKKFQKENYLDLFFDKYK